jgi:hypothetical protein
MTETIIFRVQFRDFPDVWRKIECLPSNTLDDLNNAIQVSIGWDNDHLYSFFMDDKIVYKEHNPMEYTSPNTGDFINLTPLKRANKAKLGQFHFGRLQRFGYLFDFGDDVKFNVKVTGFGKPKTGVKYPRTIGMQGKAPKQYSEEE